MESECSRKSKQNVKLKKWSVKPRNHEPCESKYRYNVAEAEANDVFIYHSYKLKNMRSQLVADENFYHQRQACCNSKQSTDCKKRRRGVLCNIPPHFATLSVSCIYQNSNNNLNPLLAYSLSLPFDNSTRTPPNCLYCTHRF